MKKLQRKERLVGEKKIPADKSISHRALMLSALCDTPVEISNLLKAEDINSTIKCLRQVGTEIEIGEKVRVRGRGFRSPVGELNAGNSGTTLRLMLGLLAGAGIKATFTGDSSLSKRPLKRVLLPLRLMGAEIDSEHLPIRLKPASLKGISYTLPIPSAQVKSAILLAGLTASTATTIKERIVSRDHTERMLESFGAKISRRAETICIEPSILKAPGQITIPNDISSAAFWIVGASIIKDSELELKDVGINGTRRGVIDVIKEMGGRIEIRNKRTSGGEEYADIVVRSAGLKSVEIKSERIPVLIDEVPILAVAASFAEGISVIHGVGELRVKESDRLQAIVREFNKLSPDSFKVSGDDLIIRGGREKVLNTCKTYGDHRIAMSLAIMAYAGNGAIIDDSDCVKISYPDFFK